MRVMLNTQTAWEGEILRPGDVRDVDSVTARRWLGHGIAHREPGVEPDAVSESEESDNVTDYDAMNVRELKELIETRGIEAKGPRAALIEALRDHDERAAAVRAEQADDDTADSNSADDESAEQADDESAEQADDDTADSDGASESEE